MSAPDWTALTRYLAILAALGSCASCSGFDEAGDKFASGTSGTASETAPNTAASTGAETEGGSSSDTSATETESLTSGSGSTTGLPTTATSSESTASTTEDLDCGGLCDPDTQVCVEGACVDPIAPDPGGVVITEFLPNPVAVTDDAGEWLELVNVGTIPVDIAGCSLTDAGAVDDDHLITAANLIIAPGATALLAKSDDMLTNGGLPPVDYAFGGTFSLTNTEDEIVLTCGGMIIDEVAYDATWPFSDGGAANLDSAEHDAAANDLIGSWCGASAPYGDGDLGTPGSANDGC